MSFKIGDKVVYIDNKYNVNSVALKPPLIMYKIYIVLEISATPCCKNNTIYVGINHKSSSQTCLCGNVYSITRDKWFHLSHRFRKVDDQFAEDLIKELETEINEEQLILK